MSRHLMARFRRQSAPAAGQWQHGFALPHVKRYLDWSNERNRDYPELQLNHEDVSTRLVNHGESRYALTIEPDDSDDPEDRESYPFRWGIHQQVGPDMDNPDHWKRLDYDEHYDEQFGGPFAENRDEAMDVADDAWGEYVQGLNQKRPGIGDYDINDIMRGEQ